MGKALLDKLKESVMAVMPITILVVILALSFTDANANVMGLFLIGAAMLIIGMSLFALGADIAMMPMGHSVGAMLSKTKKSKFWLVIIIGLVIGFVITIAEPDLHVLASSLNSKAVLYTVAVGVGIFVVVSIIRTFFKIKLMYILLASYTLLFILAIFVQIYAPDFLAAAFDSGGVTTGPISVPFLMAIGIGIASVRGSKSNQEDSFGMIALCSVGPILAVMVLGLSGFVEISEHQSLAPILDSFKDVGPLFAQGVLAQLKEVALAVAPIVGVFFLFQFVTLRLPKSEIKRIIIGILYTFVGLTLFLTGVNVGFLPMGHLLGESLAGLSYNYILIPVGLVMGILVVLAEPAIHVLNKQVEEITGGAISKKVMMVTLGAGVSVAIALAMVRVLTGVSIWWFVVPVYVISLTLMFFVPPIFTGIAFDSGGVASGPMTATFMLPLAMGASHALGGNIMSDAFGLVAFVAMAPLITIQGVGLIFKLKTAHSTRKTATAAKKTAIMPLNETVDFDVDMIEDITQGEEDSINEIYSSTSSKDNNIDDTVDFDI